MSFLIEYLRNPRRVGAIAPSGKSLARKMVQPIQFQTANVIVEYGPGTGSFTKELLAKRHANTTLILIEQDKAFYQTLKESLGEQKNVHLIHGSAENVNAYLKQYGFTKADYIVSGLPFTSLPSKVSDTILCETKTAIGAEGKFITFQYSMAKRKFFERYLSIQDRLREWKNLPPAYVFIMKN